MRPNTIARSLAIGNPADGPFAVRLAQESGGAIDAASDAEIVEGIRLLARTEGIFAETAGGVTVAVLKRLAEQGVLERDETDRGLHHGQRPQDARRRGRQPPGADPRGARASKHSRKPF